MDNLSDEELKYEWLKLHVAMKNAKQKAKIKASQQTIFQKLSNIILTCMHTV